MKGYFNLTFQWILCSAAGLLVGAQSMATTQPGFYNFEGQLTDSAGDPVLDSDVDFVITIKNPTRDCVIYEETINDQDLSATNGVFHLAIGTPGASRTANDLGLTSSQVFANNNSFNCTVPLVSTYNPSPGDERVVEVTITSGTLGTETMPPISIGSAPSASVASTLQGLEPSDFIKTNTTVGNDLDQTNVESVFTTSNYTKLMDLIGGTSSLYLKDGAGSWDSNNQSIINVGNPTDPNDAVNKAYVDGLLGGFIDEDGSVPMTADLNLDGNKIINLGAPTASDHAATKAYVDSEVAGFTETGDIESVEAGAGLTGGGTGGPVTLDIGAGTGITVGVNTVAVDVGTTAGKIVQLDGSARLPAVDGSLLTGVSDNTRVAKSGDTMTGALNLPSNGLNVGSGQLAASGGRVGVGTESPTATLDVVGNNLVKFNRTDTSGNSVLSSMQVLRTNSSGAGADGIGSLIQFMAETETEGSIEAVADIYVTATDATAGTVDGEIRFRTRQDGAVTNAMKIDSSGNVGVGTLAPEAKLDVVGEVKIGSTALACNGTTEGAQRYNSSSKVMEFCNGTAWTTFGGAAVAVPAGVVVATMAISCPTGYLSAIGNSVSRTTYSDLFAVYGTMYGPGNGTTTFGLPDLRGYFLRGQDGGTGRDHDAGSRGDRGDGTTGDSVGTVQGDSISGHTHGSGSLTGTTSTVADHSHAKGSLGGSTTTNGDHTHNAGTLSVQDRYGTSASPEWGDNNNHRPYFHQIAFRSVSVTGATAAAGNHSHSLNIAGNTAAAGSHDHSVSVTGGSTSSTGGLETRPKNINVLYCIKF